MHIFSFFFFWSASILSLTSSAIRAPVSYSLLSSSFSWWQPHQFQFSRHFLRFHNSFFFRWNKIFVLPPCLLLRASTYLALIAFIFGYFLWLSFKKYSPLVFFFFFFNLTFWLWWWEWCILFLSFLFGFLCIFPFLCLNFFKALKGPMAETVSLSHN